METNVTGVVYLINFAGEFGVVYKAHIVKNMGQIVKDVVAVKTLKGTN